MSFSAHEMMIFLRVRDEASRILGRFARNVQGVNQKVISANNDSIASAMKERNTLTGNANAVKAASREKITAMNKTIATHRNAIKIQQRETEAVRTNKAKEIVSYKQMAAATKEIYANDQKTMAKVLAALRKEHEAKKLEFDEELIGLRQVIAKKKEYLRLVDGKKQKEAQATAAAIAGTNKEIAKQKELEQAARNANRTERARASAKIAATHKQVQALQGSGMALTTVGAAAAAGGIVTVMALNNASDAAIEYRKAATTTLTQVDDKFKTTLEDIVNIGQNVASKFAVPIDEMQGSMYDLYSSMDVKNKTVATNFMVQAAKAAVGGSTDIKSATGSLISTLNSYQLKAKDVTKVNDVMFQLVRKGVGNFKEFTSAMATANPSAHRAGQTYQTTAGMLALLTRNGIKSAKAGTSVARAFDAISNPITAKNFKEMGMKIYDSTGKLKPMVKIVDMMKNSMKGLTQEQKTAKLKDMFQGSGGTIQALRFFNTALNDTKGAYKGLTNDMKNASNVTDKNGKKMGAAAIAYKQMAGTDASKILIAQNKMAIAWQKIGDAIMPVKTAIMEFFGQLADWWNKLSPQQQQGIAQFAAISAVILVVVGSITTFVGVVMLLAGAFLALDAAAWPVVLVALAIVAAIALIAYAAYLIISNWGSISKFFVDLWNTVSTWTVNTWNSIWGFITTTFNNIVNAVVGFASAVGKWFKDTWDSASKGVSDFMTAIGNYFSNMWSTYILPALSGLWEGLQTYIATLLSVIIALFTGKWGEIPGIILSGLSKITEFLVVGFANFASVFIGFFTDVSTKWSLWWQLLGEAAGTKVGDFVNWVKSVPSMIISGFMGLAVLGPKVGAWFNDMRLAAVKKGDDLLTWVKSIPTLITNALKGLSDLLSGIGGAIISGLWNGMKKMWDDAKGWITGIADWIKQHKGPISYDRKLLRPAGKAIFEGFNDELLSGFKDTKKIIGRVGPSLTIGNATGLAYSSTGVGMSNSGATIHMPIYTNEIDPVKNAADLGYEVSQRLGL